MVGPSIVPGMEQREHLARSRVEGSYVGALVPVAKHAGIGQVVSCGGAAVLAAYDVVELVREAGVIIVDKAVFTTVIGAASNFGSDDVANFTGH